MNNKEFINKLKQTNDWTEAVQIGIEYAKANELEPKSIRNNAQYSNVSMFVKSIYITNHKEFGKLLVDEWAEYAKVHFGTLDIFRKDNTNSFTHNIALVFAEQVASELENEEDEEQC